MLAKRLRRVRRASSPLRHSLGCPQLSAPGTTPGDKPARGRGIAEQPVQPQRRRVGRRGKLQARDHRCIITQSRRDATIEVAALRGDYGRVSS